jgi:hypothetical protein
MEGRTRSEWRSDQERATRLIEDGDYRGTLVPVRNLIGTLYDPVAWVNAHGRTPTSPWPTVVEPSAPRAGGRAQGWIHERARVGRALDDDQATRW